MHDRPVMFFGLFLVSKEEADAIDPPTAMRRFFNWRNSAPPELVALFWEQEATTARCVACRQSKWSGEHDGTLLVSNTDRERLRRLVDAGLDAYLAGTPEPGEVHYWVCSTCTESLTTEQRHAIGRLVTQLASEHAATDPGAAA